MKKLIVSDKKALIFFFDLYHLHQRFLVNSKYKCKNKETKMWKSQAFQNINKKYLCTTGISNENNFLCSWNEIIQSNLLLIFSRNFNSKSFASSNTINSSQVIPCKCCMLARICASFPSSNTWYYVTTIDRSTLSLLNFPPKKLIQFYEIQNSKLEKDVVLSFKNFLHFLS